MTVYIDAEYKVYPETAEGRTEAETEFFDGMCPELMMSYRYVPAGMSWTREDGKVFDGPMFAPHKNIRQHDAAQRVYERNLIAQYEVALSAIEQALEVQT